MPSSGRFRLLTSRGPLRPLLLGLALLTLGWLAGLAAFASRLDRAPAAPEGRRTQAIVVLTGGSERLAVGFDLLAADKADKLFISGVYRGVDVRELLRMGRQVPAELECCIVLGHDAADTEGNALETARWMRTEGFTSLRLVTANYHMPRSLVEFRRALPEAEIVAHPVAPPNVRLDHWYFWPGTAELIVSEYTKFLLASLRAILLGPRESPPEGEAPGPAETPPPGPMAAPSAEG
ncbi:YdcF family protein [Indioceanicola profundi]|uniref:YdcF family protein n=1 Tax=Indioceanicola profundi TaxID=2220096 RepID=UPI000E6AADDB|nr:YdcF family protein [Indioceanicola profundi]